ncbi:hypothetical protein B0T21DRAFT_381752 [Apiosordaria backusii]|uniref:AAA+ ATPase domain-containing protein n=1 Tax=Apiosordaria backusii TaxID=314023 RepID=A0AA40EMG0_9PEZI|nr:hypothetical protein B0T21DRAFT_381752 [Apiosordaria backusii]
MESTDQHSVEVREGNPQVPANSEDCKAPVENSTQPAGTEKKTSERVNGKPKDKKKAQKKSSKTKRKKSTDNSPSSSDSDIEDDTHEPDSTSDSNDSSSESESESKKKRVTKKRHEASRSKKKTRAKKSKKSSKSEGSSSSFSESESDSDTSKADSLDVSEDEISQHEATIRHLQYLLAQQQQQQQQQQQAHNQQQSAPPHMQYQRQNSMPSYSFIPARQYSNDDYDGGAPPSYPPPRSPRRNSRFISPPGGRGDYGHRDLDAGLSNLMIHPNLLTDPKLLAKEKKKQKKKEEVAKLDYKRVDQVWDNSIHNYKLQDTAEGSVDSQYHDFLFHVRRTFDWEGKYKATIVDIKSKPLRECLQDVMGNIKGVSLVESTPKLDPNLLFLYLDDFKKHLKELKKRKVKGRKRNHRKEQKRLVDKRKHLKVLIKYLDKDYAEIKKSLYPMLKNGLITFDLLWALWKPNTLAFAQTYGSPDEPRVLKIEIAEKHSSFMKGDYYYLEGKYFEYDGKQFGYGSVSEEIVEFRGARKITSLNCYPLSYHKNEAKVRKELVERGKKFVSLAGVYYKSHQGMAYYKKKKGVVKVNINGRIMVDPAIHRRINPNYPISLVRPKDHDVYSDDESSDDSDCSGCGSDEEESYKRNMRVCRPNMNGPENTTGEKLEKVSAQNEEAAEDIKDGEDEDKNDGPRNDSKDAKKIPEFSEEDYLIASPVVLGFSFAEKLWLEFTVSGVKEIQWNETAYDSLVLESKTKDIVRALVESHKYHAAESIDDVIQGKGRGLVAVLHGPPGTGKTLTAEGISELLKCPLYMVSAGELGTDSRFLESELQKILDICHAWGAILLLDEADVFLEKRNMHDIHRNALVSIFLKQVEYVQNILILTTNRVETFDDAFQSRIHIALRYDNLDHKAKKAIFKIFIERVRAHEGSKLGPFTDSDYENLARRELNGRQIKNTVRTAQALAVNKGEALCMSHIRQVLDVQANFERDLKGGPGYQEAMRSYF